MDIKYERVYFGACSVLIYNVVFLTHFLYYATHLFNGKVKEHAGCVLYSKLRFGTQALGYVCEHIILFPGFYK